MSFAAMTWASKQKTGSPTRKLILLLLADRANDDGYCWPSLKTIAEDCELKKDSVIRNLKRLENDGFIRIVKRKVDGVYLQNHYVLNLRDGAQNVPPEGGSRSEIPGVYGEQGVVAQKDRGSRSERQGVVAQSDTNQSIEPVSEPKKENCLKESRGEAEEPTAQKRADAPKEKKRSFNLSTKQPYSKLSEAYRRMLYGYAITRDGAEQYQAFIDYHAAKGSAFKDWAAAYRTWLRNVVKYGGTLSQPREVTGQMGEALYLDYTGSSAVIKGDESYTPRPVKKRPSEPVRSGYEETAPRRDVMRAVGDLAEKVKSGFGGAV